MPPQQITLAGDVFRICLKPVYITRGEPQDASLGKLKITHNPPLLYPQILLKRDFGPFRIGRSRISEMSAAIYSKSETINRPSVLKADVEGPGRGPERTRRRRRI